jgi:sugar/nucleoside kinase (ribokinase family)
VSARDGTASVLAVGETMVLVTPGSAQPLESAAAFRLDVAGAESNVASHLARAGTAAAWAGAVGDDALDRRLLATLAARGVDTAAFTVSPAFDPDVVEASLGAGSRRCREWRRPATCSGARGWGWSG